MLKAKTSLSILYSFACVLSWVEILGAGTLYVYMCCGGTCTCTCTCTCACTTVGVEKTREVVPRAPRVLPKMCRPTDATRPRGDYDPSVPPRNPWRAGEHHGAVDSSAGWGSGTIWNGARLRSPVSMHCCVSVRSDDPTS